MTKEFQEELKEKIKPRVKASELKKLKRSKSADDIPSPSNESSSNIPLKKSQSQLEIPFAQPSSKEQISQLKEQVKFHAETASNYLKSLQSSQAKVSELEGKLKSNPSNVLLSEQLATKQKEIEQLRKKLEEKNEELKSLKEEQSTLLDDNLTLKHQGLKDWWQQYQQTQQLEKELAENVEYASNELVEQDKVIEKLRSENSKLKKEKQSLQKDLNLVQKLAELRRSPYPEYENNWTYLKYALYSLGAVLFTLWLTNNLSNKEIK